MAFLCCKVGAPIIICGKGEHSETNDSRTHICTNSPTWTFILYKSKKGTSCLIIRKNKQKKPSWNQLKNYKRHQMSSFSRKIKNTGSVTVSGHAPLCQIFLAGAVLGLSCRAGWWLRRWGSGQTDSSRPWVWEAEQPAGSPVPTSWFSSDTESPARLRTAHRDSHLLPIEHARTRPAASPRSHPAEPPPPEIIVQNYW